MRLVFPLLRSDSGSGIVFRVIKLSKKASNAWLFGCLYRDFRLGINSRSDVRKRIRDRLGTGARAESHLYLLQLSSSMVSLKLQKRLAASILNCGKRKIWLDPNEVR